MYPLLVLLFTIHRTLPPSSCPMSMPILPARDELRILNKHKQKESDTARFVDLNEGGTYRLIYHRITVVNKRSLRIGGYLRLYEVAIYQTGARRLRRLIIPKLRMLVVDNRSGMESYS